MATLERFEFPEEAIAYVTSSLWSSKSCVVTADGPSEPFDVLSSVRQGDPLAPLIFILVLDALHCGLDCTHAQGRVKERHPSGTSGPCTISCGPFSVPTRGK